MRTDPGSGLTSAEAAHRLTFAGYNEFEESEKESLLQKYLEQV
jgi:magnesium-transporting ATPase (P-type)